MTDSSSRRQVLRTGATLSAIAVAGCLGGGGGGSTLGDEEWTSYQADGRNTGYADNAGPASKPERRWSHDANGRVLAGPTLADGTVYVGQVADGKSLAAVDAASGETEWEFGGAGLVESTPTVADGTVYVGDKSKRVYAVDAASGEKQWQFGTNGEVRDAPAVVDGTVYAVARGGKLFAVDAASGEESWNYGGDTFYPPAVTDGTVYVSNWGLHAVDAASGEKEWSAGGSPTLTSPTVVDGTVYAGRKDGTVRAYSTSDGEEQWQYGVNGKMDVFNDLAVGNGSLYVAETNAVHAVDAASGEQQWTADLKRATVPCVVGDTVYVGRYRPGEVVAFDAESGERRWTISAGNSSGVYSVSVANGVLYLTSGQTKRVSAYEAP